MRIAFKEWAVVVDALGQGRQVVILRKGGISEGRGGFQVDYPEFVFFSTLYHQQRESVMPEAQARYDVIAPLFPPPDLLRIEYAARVVAWRKVGSLEAAQRLHGQHIWRDEVVAERFEWGREQNIFALAVRVSRLPVAVELPMLSQYSGCKSWIDLETEVDTTQASPVLNEKEFGERLRDFEAALDQ